MPQRSRAVAAAVVSAVVLGLPLTAAAVLETQSAREAREAERAATVAAIGAISQARGAVRVAAPAAVATSAAGDAAMDVAEGVAARVAERAAHMADTVPVLPRLTVTLAPGDTWQSVAAEWGLSGTQLGALNPNTDLNALAVGDTLTVYRYRRSVPPISRGNPNRGRVINGMPMPNGEHWVVRDHDIAWGTDVTISALVRGFTVVGEAMPGGGTPLVADISRRRGGRLPPHRSHASGRDVDATYYRTDPSRTVNFEPTSRHTMDHARQWNLFKYWIERDLVTYIFIDHRLQRSLYDYAAAQGEDPALLARAFGSRRGRGLLRYAPGHDDHYHVRFVCRADDTSCRE